MGNDHTVPAYNHRGLHDHPQTAGLNVHIVIPVTGGGKNPCLVTVNLVDGPPVMFYFAAARRMTDVIMYNEYGTQNTTFEAVKSL